ncbi:hypothetical protein NKI86_31625 [Mesorhizobium sp. M0320]|uniref:hypothetical protein n=1 Tax=Mesorhizobium sp. M0320 TaxID=2956936 RepID=UPI0033386DB5
MQSQRTFEFKKPNRQKLGMPKPARWSHQNDLDALKGKKVTIGILDSGPMTGVLVEADQFTVKMAAKDESSKAVVIFKSALTYFNEV